MYDVYDPALAQEPIKKIILEQLLNKMRPNSLFTTHELNARVSFSNRLLSIVHLLGYRDHFCRLASSSSSSSASQKYSVTFFSGTTQASFLIFGTEHQYGELYRVTHFWICGMSTSCFTATDKGKFAHKIISVTLFSGTTESFAIYEIDQSNIFGASPDLRSINPTYLELCHLWIWSTQHIWSFAIYDLKDSQ